MEQNLIPWTCLHCFTPNEDDAALTLFPYCLNCGITFEWTAILTEKQFKQYNLTYLHRGSGVVGQPSIDNGPVLRTLLNEGAFLTFSAAQVNVFLTDDKEEVVIVTEGKTRQFPFPGGLSYAWKHLKSQINRKKDHKPSPRGDQKCNYIITLSGIQRREKGVRGKLAPHKTWWPNPFGNRDYIAPLYMSDIPPMFRSRLRECVRIEPAQRHVDSSYILVYLAPETEQTLHCTKPYTYLLRALHPMDGLVDASVGFIVTETDLLHLEFYHVD